MVDTNTDENMDVDDPAKQYDYLLDCYATLTVGDIVLICQRVCKLILTADEVSYAVASRFDHACYEPMLESEGPSEEVFFEQHDN